MMKRVYSHIVLGWLCLLLLLASCGAERHIKEGDKYLSLGEYFDAGQAYRKAYLQTSPKERDARGQIARKMGYCYDRSLQVGRAVAAYRNAVRYHQASWQDLRRLAQLLMKNGDYKAAAETYRLVLDSVPNDTLSRVGLVSAQEAKNWQEEGSRYKVKKMDVFNSRRADYSPMLSGTQYDRIYFTSTRNEALGRELSGITGMKPGDILVSDKDDKGQWRTPEPVSGELNTAWDEGVCTLSKDGREMYLTQCVTDPTYPRYARIVKSTRSDASWGKASEVKISRDTLSTFAHPALSPDGQWLYFVSDMPGGMGGKDIWRVRMDTHGLGAVENLGSPINTPGDEMFPAFRPNGDFYFSSNGHPGLGGLDIYVARVGQDGQYHVKHLGYPLNSSGDDFGMTFEGMHNRGFFSSNRGDSRGWDHIYAFDNPEITQTVHGWVYEREGYELPQAQVYVVGDDGTNKMLPVQPDGSFVMQMRPAVSYLFMASCKGFLNHQEEVHAWAHPSASRDTTLQFALANISAPVLIDNIFYDFDKATLRDSSKQALDQLVSLLKENPNVTIELSAHTDYKGSADYNKRLSQRRAEAVVRYLTEHGVAADRMVAVGYGKEKPKVIKKKTTEKYPWLKTGDVLSEGYIKALKDSTQQEVCNQLNRRTEFRVLSTTYGLFDEHGKLKPSNLPKSPKSTEGKTQKDDWHITFD